MRFASSNRLFSAAFMAALMLGSTAFGDTMISNWSIQNDGTRDTVELQWSENGKVEVNEYATARQLVAVPPGAMIRSGIPTKLAESNSPLLNRARLQEVTLPSGEPAVQLTIQLNEWTTFNTETKDDKFVLRLDVQQNLQKGISGSTGKG